MKQKPINVLLVGIGGYGDVYLEDFRAMESTDEARLCAVVDPLGREQPAWPELEAAGVPCFDDIEACIGSGIDVDLAVIVSPIAYHADHACAALKAGIHVLCEKPICATMDDARRMLAARDASGMFLEIGYQWSFSEAIQRLKADLLAGRLGTPKRLLTRVAWPRSVSYYQRNNWAGCIRDKNGKFVYDSPVNNATAHFLHNMLYVCGASQELSATPLSLTAECYRANPIENFDAACCRVETAEVPEILFYTAHCVKEVDGPHFSFECEEAQVEFSVGGEVIASLSDGRRISYGNPDLNRMRKFRHCLQRCRAPQDYTDVCGPEAAMAHTRCVEAIQGVGVRPLPEADLSRVSIKPGDALLYFPAMNAAMRDAYAEGQLFSEAGMPWAMEAQRVAISVPVGSGAHS